MNLADLKDRVFRMTNHLYSDTFHMRDLINNALLTLSNEAKIEGVETIYVIQGIANYDLPDTYKSARALVEGTIDNPLMVYDLVTLDDSRSGYALWNGEILIKPTPEQDKELNFYFYKYATTLVNDDDELEAAFLNFGDVVASYAAAMILSLPGMDANRYLIDRYFAVWEEGRQRFKNDRAKQNKQATVRMTSNW